MLLIAKKEEGGTRYSLVIDDSERKLINFMPGDRELIKSATDTPNVSEKLVALALLAKRIEEGREISKALQAASVPPEIPTPPVNNANN